MATFPSLTPSAAPITPGAWPVTATSSLNGAETRIRHGSAEIGRRLRLAFTNVTESDFLAILAHYRGQRSGFDSFGFDTTTLAADLTPAGFAWLYASRPQVTDEHTNCFTVQCEFKCEPRGLVVSPGKRWRTPASTFTPGARSNGVVTAAWVSNTTFTPGERDSGTNLSLLLHMDGANNSTTFTDSSVNGFTVTRTGSPVISTAQSKFSGASAYFPAIGDYISVAPATAHYFPGDFIIDQWLYQPNYDDRLMLSSSNSNQNNVQIFRCNAGVNGNLGIYIDNNEAATGWVIGPVSSALTTGAWSHLRFARKGSTAKLFVNGTAIGTKTSWTQGFRVDVVGALFNGGTLNTGLGAAGGYMDEVRTRKECPTLDNFTPPSDPYS
jgi:hypothetical protein